MDECARLSCDKPAQALLTFSPHEAKAWLYDLVEPDPNCGIILCRKHANATVVPMSWQLVDARDPAWPGPPLETDETVTLGLGDIADDAQQLDEASPAIPVVALPSDNSTDDEFAGLVDGLPVTPRPYVPELVEVGASRAPDPSLFELPLTDVPAVTPYPDN